MPPLRDRRSDVPLLVARALADTPARAVSEATMAALSRHEWPGNVRELFLVVRRADALHRAEGNRTLAAKLLGIPRPQLYAKLDEHGLEGRRPRTGG